MLSTIVCGLLVFTLIHMFFTGIGCNDSEAAAFTLIFFVILVVCYFVFNKIEKQNNEKEKREKEYYYSNKRINNVESNVSKNIRANDIQIRENLNEGTDNNSENAKISYHKYELERTSMGVHIPNLHFDKSNIPQKVKNTANKEEKSLNDQYYEMQRAYFENKRFEYLYAPTREAYNACQELGKEEESQKYKENLSNLSKYRTLRDSSIIYNSNTLTVLEKYIKKANDRTILDVLSSDVDNTDYNDSFNKFFKKYDCRMYNVDNLKICFLSSVIIIFDKQDKRFYLRTYSELNYKSINRNNHVEYSFEIEDISFSVDIEDKKAAKDFGTILDNLIEFETSNARLLKDILNNKVQYINQTQLKQAFEDAAIERDRIEEEEYDKELARLKRQKAKENKGLTEYQIRRKEQLEMLKRAEKLEKERMSSK